MRIDILSVADHSSFLVPALGFNEPGDGERYMMKRTNSFADLFDAVLPESIEYLPIQTQSRIYVPNRNMHVRLSASSLAGKKPRDAERVQWVVLREKRSAMPPGAYNIMLLASGPRKFERVMHPSKKYSEEFLARVNGSRDCYCAWGTKDGHPIRGRVIDNETSRLSAARYGRGVLYSVESLFSQDGDRRGYKIVFVGLEFNTLDRDNNKDDMIKVSLVHRSQSSENIDSLGDILEDDLLAGLDNGWFPIVRSAQNGMRRLISEKN